MYEIGIITGTFNRLSYLRRMVQSVRDQIPRHISYIITLIDGGSTDGSIEWVEQQSDIQLIRHGELRGAIKSFSEGARKTDARYIIMGNDDIVFHNFSIMRAFAHLEENRTCGICCFADNRYAQVTQEEPQEYRVMQMPAIDTDGKPVSVNYGQVAMVRSWIGNRVAWWGDKDAHLSKARTYAGDNYLSAMTLELGYSVDAVNGVAIDDHIPPDALRKSNTDRGAQDSAQYYARFPRGPYLKPYPQVHNPDRERLRIVVMDIHEARLPARKAKEQGLAEAFAEIGLVYHIDQVNEPRDLVSVVRAFRPHLLFVQLHDTDRVNAEVLRQCRAEKPDLCIVTWNGDAHEKGLIAPDILDALQEADLQTVVNAKILPTYKRSGIHAAYWQIGAKMAAEPYSGNVPRHTVLFQGNAYNDERLALVQTLQASGLEVGLYGNLPNANGFSHYDFAMQEALNAAAVVVIGDTYPNTEGFVSNRLFQVLAAGGFLLQQYSPKLDKLTGLKADKHYVSWSDLAELRDKLIVWTNPKMADKRRQIAEAGQSFVLANFTYPRQVEKLIELL